MPASKTGLCAVKRALTFVGESEHPPGSNRSQLIDTWNRGAGVPVGSQWCMSFAHAMFKACGVTLGGWASVGNFLAWANADGYAITRPRRGDLCCHFWDADNWPDHVSTVVRVLALRFRSGRFVGWIRYVAGNEGNAVVCRTRWCGGRERFCRVP